MVPNLVKAGHRVSVWNRTLAATRRLYEPGFKLTPGLKDVNLALEAAKAKQALLPAAEIVRETMLEAVEQGLGSKDWSALAKVTRGVSSCPD
jgi:3-hydroxyisobutyrate dehydrogenase-like beta-hydroxyacid dehydrogenase